MKAEWTYCAEAICAACGSRCCFGAHPPLSPERKQIIQSRRGSDEGIELDGYERLGIKEDGTCVMLAGKKCMIHAFKPETCVAGPFTFSVSDHTLEVFLKREAICPLVAQLKCDHEVYEDQFHTAVDRIMRLVNALSEEELAIISAIPEDETDLVARLPLHRDQS